MINSSRMEMFENIDFTNYRTVLSIRLGVSRF